MSSESDFICSICSYEWCGEDNNGCPRCRETIEQLRAENDRLRNAIFELASYFPDWLSTEGGSPVDRVREAGRRIDQLRAQVAQLREAVAMMANHKDEHGRYLDGDAMIDFKNRVLSTPAPAMIEREKVIGLAKAADEVYRQFLIVDGKNVIGVNPEWARSVLYPVVNHARQLGLLEGGR